MRNAYIPNNPVDKVGGYLALFADRDAGTEKVPTEASLGRVSSSAVYAEICDPVYNAAAMDGIAVCAEKTASASEKTPLRLNENVDFVYVNTGNPVSDPFNAVIMIEDVIVSDDGTVVARTQGVEVPYRRGRLTTVSGNFLTSGYGGGGVDIDTDWDDDTFEVEF